MVKNGCGQSGCRILELTVSQECTDGLSRFFKCCCKFGKAKSCFNDYLMVVVKNGNGLLVHETVKSALL